MVFVYVREDNPRALAGKLSPVQMHNHTITFILHQHACGLCSEIIDVNIGISHTE